VLLEFMTWIKGLRPISSLVEGSIVINWLEFMTWIKGLRLEILTPQSYPLY